MGSFCFKSEESDGLGFRPTATVKPHVRQSGTLRTNTLCTCRGQDVASLRISSRARTLLRISSNSSGRPEEACAPREADEMEGRMEYANMCSLDLWDPVQRSLLSMLNAKDSLEAEFENIPLGLEKPHNSGLSMENLNKNRFKSILPYEETRVVLREFGDCNSNDYINANYIRGYKQEKKYIAAQGPKENTTTDFWRMVWQERITHIVMLTNCEEGKRDKCDEYWPPAGAGMEHGAFIIMGLEVVDRADYEIRTFEINQQGEKRRVVQYHYVTWADHSTPKVTDLVDFWRRVRIDYHVMNEHGSPLLVHCSAGVGRTGTFIALDILMDQALEEGEINVPQVVVELRKDRCNMVQAKDQYQFVYKAVLEAYSGYSSRVLLDGSNIVLPFLSESLYEQVDAELQMLLQMKKLDRKPVYTSARSDENINKNRNIEVLPDENYLVYLTCRVADRNQYINAVYLSSFADWNGWILTQLPLPDTVVDVWRLVQGAGITTIVSLGPEADSPENGCYWPRQMEEQRLFDSFEVSLVSHAEFGEEGHVYDLTLTYEKEPPQKVRLYHLGNWSHDLPCTTPDVLKLAELLAGSEEEQVVPPVLVQCIDGAFRSGLFCALCDVISRVKYDRELDVYTTVRKLHVVRPQSVDTQVQYRYLYEAVEEYIRGEAIYANTCM
ncbi:receptor-type tyrosine-protein phosphatase alpha-like isoform X2 [Pomacea canaliculata]|uniref:receptor-type tyrosine-protein phosphatase alpha-like isoform X2 n=1 Tax=Pomacea canaliculata TaxID=400727 RepID=UPI000D738206|nr:receptor-type tyrosine-protein phosphatase alpha-like isoform X2 [Pomacea canaliculata]